MNPQLRGGAWAILSSCPRAVLLGEVKFGLLDGHWYFLKPTSLVFLPPASWGRCMFPTLISTDSQTAPAEMPAGSLGCSAAAPLSGAGGGTSADNRPAGPGQLPVTEPAASYQQHK